MIVRRQATYLSVMLVLLAGISCKKDTSCDYCGATNKPPVTIAGKDQFILLPLDSTVLDGSASSDPDGTISAYQWTKLSGPASFNIVTPTSSRTVVKGLIAGVYQFELKITDNKGTSGRDTISVTVSTGLPGNRPPVARAGADQTITLPLNSVTVNGSASTDPDNNIVNYSWTKISGPLTFVIGNANSQQTQITNLIEGSYLFQLTVTDAGGLFSKDTLVVTVNSSSNCSANRTTVTAQLTPVSSILPGAGYFATIGNKIYFLVSQCGSCEDTAKAPAFLYIFDVISQAWSFSQTTMMRPRGYGAIVTAGNKIYYAGGYNTNESTYSAVLNDVDIYDAATDTWSGTFLSVPRSNLSGAVVNNKIVFAGGLQRDPAIPPSSFAYIPSDNVDIIDATGSHSSTAHLNQARSDMSVVSVNNKVYFAGGIYANNIISSKVDVYDESSGTWSAISLAEPKAFMAAIAVNNKIFWAGGASSYSASTNSYVGVSSVEVRDLNSNSSSFTCLFKPNYKFTTAARASKVVFFTGGIAGDIKNKFDIYDINTNSWSVGILADNANGTIISINNTFYLVGSYGTLGGKIWKLEF